MARKDSSGTMQRKQFAFKAEDVAADGTFTGYGSVFGNVDSYREIVLPGAFTDSIKAIAASGDPLPMLWQHRSDQPIGGYTALAEDVRGLKVTGFLLKDEVQQAAEAYALMKARIVKGLSIGYYVEADSYNEKDNVRSLIKLDLREISPVTFPANTEAQVDSVKCALALMLKAGQLPNLKDFEDFLREAGFSKTQANAIAGGGLSKLLRGEPGGEKGDILAALRGFTITP
jgi:HK97 family phage prohead protease